jgi:carboxymethylenebutenolidase
MSVTTNYVSLAVSDGTTMQAYTATPEGDGLFTGLLLFQEAFGVNAHIRSLAERFAAEGFLTIAPELFHRTAPAGFEGSYSDFASVAPHFQGLTPEMTEADIHAVHNWLTNNNKVRENDIVSTGYCMGGRVSFHANCIVPLRVAVSYYGGGIAAQLIHRAPELHGPMLFFWGGLDQHITHEQVEQVVLALKNAGKDYVNVEISYANHGFFCDARPSYHPKAAREAWPLTLAFLKG